MASANGGLIGTGLVPGGSIGQELAAITRRAFIPKLIVQIYKASPVLNMLMRGSQRAAGGVGQITVPVQGNSLVTAEWTDFGGSFNQPADVTGIQNAAQNLTVAAVPIPFFGMESLIQSSEVVIPRLKTKMADAKQVMVQLLSNALFTFNTNVTYMSGLPQAYDDGTGASSVYANIDRSVSSNAFWKSTVITTAGAVLTRSAFIKYILQTTSKAGGESPDLIILSLSDWTTLMQDFMTVEQFHTTPGVRYGQDTPINAGFRALMLGDVPIVADLYCPKGTAYLVNTKYFALYLSEDAPFAFSGFYSAIPNLQIANIGVVIVALQTICTKPISGMQITGITGGAF
jgi:hypothetical protein